jgi:hypothetical protein
MTFVKKETQGEIHEEEGIKGKRRTGKKGWCEEILKGIKRAGRRTVCPHPALS